MCDYKPKSYKAGINFSVLCLKSSSLLHVYLKLLKNLDIDDPINVVNASDINIESLKS